ncbi:TonB-dependent hemoglobin/transferrin/lactoferrin family receptor [Ancylobacter sp. G4_0304]|uniref:TonB-dependent hemoglobin/transferrin/lactoferrin family receptor n=1 Tax=Ancylobacter sp. G4_0304 TaxID=3114289 RepID=UPI0039C71BFF
MATFSRRPTTRVLGWGVSLLALMTAAPAIAQQASTAAVVETGEFVELDPVTVIASRGTTESWIDTLAPVSVVRPADLERMMPTRAEDLFRGMPGVTAIQNGNSAQTSINIRGLQDFGRVAVFVDGARQNFTQLGHANAAGSFFLEPGLIADVDVVRGPVSNIYGSGAIGGVVGLRTKDLNDILIGDNIWGVEADAEGATNGPMGYGSLLAGSKVGENVDVFLGGTYRNQDDYKDGNGDTVDGTGYETWTGLAKLTVRPADFHEVKLSALNYESRYTTSSETPTPSTTQYGTTVANRMVTAQWNYSNPDDSLFDWRSEVYWNQVDQDQTKVAGSNTSTVTGPLGATRNFTIDTTGFDANNTSRFDWGAVENAVTYGGDYFYDEVNNTDAYGFGEGYNPSGNRGAGGAFVQWKANYSTWLEVIGALRYDAYSLNGGGVSSSGDHLSPKITVGITPVDWLTVYGTFAEGYRAPSVTETLVADAHPAFFAGGLAPFTFLPNPNLKPEIGENKEVGVNIQKDGLFVANDRLRIKANYYQNDVENYIELQTFGAPACIMRVGPRCVAFNPYSYAQYQNVEEARLRGFEFEGQYDAGRWFLNVSGQTTEGEVTAGPDAGDPLSSVMPDQVSTTLGFRFLDNKLTVAARWTAVASVSAEEAGGVYEPTDSFNLVSLYAGYQPNESTLWRVSVENLLDEQYTQYQNFLPSAGLTVKAGLTVRFGGGAQVAAAPLITK